MRKSLLFYCLLKGTLPILNLNLPLLEFSSCCGTKWGAPAMYSSSLGRRHYIWPSCSRNSIRGHGKQQLSRAADGRQRLVVQLLTFPCNGNRNALFLAAVGFWHGQFLLVTVRDNQVEAADVRYIQVHFWFV